MLAEAAREIDAAMTREEARAKTSGQRGGL